MGRAAAARRGPFPARLRLPAAHRARRGSPALPGAGLRPRRRRRRAGRRASSPVSSTGPASALPRATPRRSSSCSTRAGRCGAGTRWPSSTPPTSTPTASSTGSPSCGWSRPRSGPRRCCTWGGAARSSPSWRRWCGRSRSGSGSRRCSCARSTRGGRQTDALAVYQKLRRHLVDELGIEPAESTRAVHRQLLEQDPQLSPRAPGPPTNLPRRGHAVRQPRWRRSRSSRPRSATPRW